MMTPKLTICIPTYNREKFLARSFDALVSQFDEYARRNVEILISDNASTDSTYHIAQELIEAHPQITIRLVRNEINLGMDGNFYSCYKKALGEFVCLFSDDDFLLPGRLKQLLNILITYSRIDAIFLNSFECGPTPDPFKDAHMSEDVAIFYDRDEILRIIGNRIVHLGALVLRRSIVERNEYDHTIGSYLLISYIFLDVFNNGNGVCFVRNKVFEITNNNSGGYDFFAVFATNFDQVLQYAKALGFSSKVTRRVSKNHLRYFIIPFIIGFRINNSYVRMKRNYIDGVRRTWAVYGFSPLFVVGVLPAVFAPKWFWLLVRAFVRLLRKLGRAQRPLPDYPSVSSVPLAARVNKLEDVICGVCAGVKFRTLFDARDYNYGNVGAWPVSECVTCHVYLMNPRIPSNDIGAYYPAGYYTNDKSRAVEKRTWRRCAKDLVAARQFGSKMPIKHSGPSLIVAWILLPFTKRWTITSKFIDFVQNGRVLDVGCGNGQLLLEYNRFGWNVEGIEVSERSAASAREMGLKVFCGELTAAKFNDAEFDAVTLWDALEHIHNPKEIMTEINRITRPNGKVYISVPNIDSLWFRAFRDKWQMFTAPIHYFHYTKETLTFLLIQSGYTDVVVRYPLGDAGVRHTLKSAWTADSFLGRFIRFSLVDKVICAFDLIAPRGHIFATATKGK